MLRVIQILVGAVLLSTALDFGVDARIHFKVPVKPAHAFYGRSAFLYNFTEFMRVNGDRGAVVTGIPQIGKTESVIRFIYEEESQRNYGNLIWIDATNEQTLKHSFFELARQDQVNITSAVKFNLGYILDARPAFEELYMKFVQEDAERRSKTLIVFDNAREMMNSDNDTIFGILPSKVLPPSISSRGQAPHVILTSREINTDWKELKSFNLDVMGLDEVVNILREELKLNTESIIESTKDFKNNHPEVLDLAKLIIKKGLPITLRSPIEYLRGMTAKFYGTKLQKTLTRNFILNYVKELKNMEKSFFSFRFSSSNNYDLPNQDPLDHPEYMDLDKIAVVHRFKDEL